MSLRWTDNDQSITPNDLAEDYKKRLTRGQYVTAVFIGGTFLGAILVLLFFASPFWSQR